MPNLNPLESYRLLVQKTKEAISSQFPIEGNIHRLELTKLEIEDDSATGSAEFNPANYDSQLDARLNGRTWGPDIVGHFRLIEKETGKVIDQRKRTLGKLPKITTRYSFIVDGNEKQFDSVFRLNPGAYHAEAQNGDLVAKWNVAAGSKVGSFDIFIERKDPKKVGFIYLQVKSGGSSTRKIPVIPVLNAMGIDDAKIRSTLGDGVYEVNKKYSKPGDIIKFHEAIEKRRDKTKYKQPSIAVAREFTRATFEGAEVSEQTMKSALGKEFSNITGEALLLSAKKLVDISKGRAKEDDRQSLSNKRLYGVEDFVAEELTKGKTAYSLTRKIRNNVDRKNTIREIIPASASGYGAAILKPFKAAQLPTQTNPLQFLSNHTKTTILGAAFGGIKGDNVNLMQDKLINPSHLGLLDPLQTPESQQTGVHLHVPMGAQKKGHNLMAQVVNVRTGKVERKSAADLERAVVAYPDQVKITKKPNGTVVVKPKTPDVVVYDKDRNTSKRPWKEVDYVLPSAKLMFAVSANLIPFIQNDNGNRSMMAAKHQEQAVGLKDREAPLVQTSAAGGASYEGLVGSTASVTSSAAGQVISVSKKQIVVKGSDGKRYVHSLYDNYPLNGAKHMLDSTPSVKVGDKVKKGQLLADSNFTKGGRLALGTNLRVAYIPYKGYNFEDGIVISESAAKKLVSNHLHSVEAEMFSNVVVDKALWRRYAGAEKASPDILRKLDDRGIVKVGTVVEPDDVLIAKLVKQDNSRDTANIKKQLKGAIRDFNPAEERWKHEYKGKVVRVVSTGKKISVFIRTEQTMEVGDKLSGRHGNKGIVTRILPDDQMPKDKKGNAVQVLMSPAGVPSRMNPGQILETAVGKVALKTGKPFVVDNFNPDVDYSELVKSELKKHKISDTEELFDPETGESLGQVFTGPQYILKLDHQAEKKISARAGGAGYTYKTTGEAAQGSGIGKGGQRIGGLDTYTLLAHGAKFNLREMQTYKSDKDQANDTWNRILRGERPPTPQVPRSMLQFQKYMRAMGVSSEKSGREYSLMPMTDAQTKSQSSGQLAFPEKTLSAKGSLTKEERGGLFDRGKTGGLEGEKWSHMDLGMKVPNPLFEEPIRSLLGMKKPEFQKLLTAEGAVGGKSGFQVIEEKLSKMNVNTELKKAEAELKTAKEAELNVRYKRVRYLRALKDLGVKPVDAYMNSVLPILPPTLRRVSIGFDGTQIIDPVNIMYAQTGAMVQQLKKSEKERLPIQDIQKNQAEVYKLVKALRLTGMQIEGRHAPSLMDKLSGLNQPKQSFFQSGVLGKRQDLSGRSVITPDPEMPLDEVGMPREMALEMYKPFVIKALWKDMGRASSPLQARMMVKKKHPAAYEALERVIKDRPAMMKRDPALHMFSIMAFRPRLVEGRSIKIHPLVVGGFNADFDGDQQIGSVFLSISRDMFNADFDFWGPREVDMAARFKEQISFLDEDEVLVTCDLEDFPTAELVKTKGHIEFWSVPGGLRVVGIDEQTGEPGLFEVAYWSKHHDRVVEIVTLGSGRQIITDDDERAVFGVDADTLIWCRRRPAEAENQYVPVMDSIPTPSTLRELDGFADPKGVYQKIHLCAGLGYLLGSLVGDGWVVQSQGSPRGVAFSSSSQEVRDKWELALLSVFADHPPVTHQFSDVGKFPGSSGSWKSTVTSAAFGRFISPLIGQGARNKHLPPFFLRAPTDFVGGLLSGLWDTDGSFSWSAAKGRRQFMASYSSTSIRLVQEIQHLLRTIGVGSRVTPTKTPKGAPCWILSLSTPELYDAMTDGRLVLGPAHEGKRAALEEFLAGDRPDKKGAYSRYRLVPLPPSLAKELRKLFPSRTHASIYASLSKALASDPRKHISKELARRIVDLVEGRCSHPLFEKWSSLVEQEGFHFEAVKDVQFTEITETGYDLTVPGAENFMSVDGVVLSNTMAMYVPITEKAVDEAKAMMPSKNLFSPTSNKLMVAPSMDAVLGIYQATKWGKKRPGTYTDTQAIKLLKAGKLKSYDVITVSGYKRPTTPGRLLINSTLPKEFKNRDDLLYDKDFRMAKGGMKGFATEVARANPEEFSKMIDQWKNLGFNLSYKNGSSFSLNDFHDGKEIRDQVLKKYKAEEAKIRKGGGSQKSKDAKIVKLYQAAQKELKTVGEARYNRRQDNRMWEWAQSGARGNWGQFSQMVMGPMIVQDPLNKPVAFPITKSFGEGLPISQYYASLHGARKGTIDRASATAKPGALTKELINTVIDNKIRSKDCGTKKGALLSPSLSDVEGRFLGSDVPLKGGQTLKRGTLVTAQLRQQIKKSGPSKILVRSPLGCREVKGICATCYGLSERGSLYPVGTNVGVIAGHALGEPITQMQMKTFHTGGVGGESDVGDYFTAAEDLFKVPSTLKGAATLAEVTGRVQKIETDALGGKTVTIDGKKHVVPHTNQLLPQIRVGYEVKKAEALSNGRKNPHDILRITKSMGAVRNHLTDSLSALYVPTTGHERRRNIETVIRAMTDLTRIDDPGDDSSYLRGQLVPMSEVEAKNRDLKAMGKRPIKHKPKLKAMNQMPLAGQEDWMARLNFQRLKETYIEGAAQNWKSDIHGHPISGIAHGAEFGLEPPQAIKPPGLPKPAGTVARPASPKPAGTAQTTQPKKTGFFSLF